MSLQEERLRVLEMIAAGTINASQGTDLLQALAAAGEAEADADPLPEAESAPAEGVSLPGEGGDPGLAAPAPDNDPAPAVLSAGRDAASPVPTPPAVDHFAYRWLWALLAAAGTGVTASAGMLWLQGRALGWHWFWLTCLLGPVLFGLALLALGAASRKMPWLHVRVQRPGEEWPQNIAISLPLPLRPARWLVRLLGLRIRGLPAAQVEAMVRTLGQADLKREPFSVEVNQGPGEPQVQVYIG